MDWISALGTAGTLGFGIVSLYQWNVLQAQRRAIEAHTQTAYNNFWNIGNEMEQLLKVALDTNATLDHATVVRRSSAANAVSMSARHEVINFGRKWADFAPKYEQGWDPEPAPKKLPLLKRLLP
jgi:LytS/YehU family sensor histidine kinase